MSNFCDHCEGQRFDRARVLRALRRVRKDLRKAKRGRQVDEALAVALHAVKILDIAHLDDDEADEGEVVH